MQLNLKRRKGAHRFKGKKGENEREGGIGGGREEGKKILVGGGGGAMTDLDL